MSIGKLGVGGATVALWVALLGVLAPSALAAAPEAPGPVTVQSPVGATKAMVHGVLSPAAEGHPGTYEFPYKKGSASCEGEGKAPESPGLMLGFEAEAVSQELTGLEPDTKYTVCLRAETKGGATVGPAVTFTTARALEAPTTTSPAGDVTATTATLLGALNPGTAAEAGESYEFRYRASGAECEGEGEAATPREAATGAKGEEVEAKLTELQPNRQYTFCLLAVNAAEETSVGAPVTFKTSTAPIAIADETFSEVRAHSANVSAQIDLGNESGSYLFQYGTPAEFQAGAERATGETQVSAVEGAVSATGQLAELEPASEYEVRIVVTSAREETATGALERFDTMAAETAGLPDGRVYEMVTPPDNQDADVYVPYAPDTGSLSQGVETFWLFQAATDGDGVTYVADPTSAGYGEAGKGLGNQYLAGRSPGGGWRQTVLQPPGWRKTSYQAFSGDLMTGVLNSGNGAEPTVPPLTGNAPAHGYSVLYTRDDFTEANVEEDLYKPLYTSSVAFNLGAEAFGVPVQVYSQNRKGQRPAFAGATSGFGELFFEANDDLTSPGDPLRPALDARIKAEPNGESDYLYDSVDEHDVLVDVLPDGEVAGNATFGAVPLGTGESNTPDFSGVVSPDGRWAYWTDLAAGPEENRVFVRENAGAPESPRDGQGTCVVAADACTVAVSAGPARYWTSAGEGRYVFYEESGQLLRYDALSKTSEPWTQSSAGVLGILGAGSDGNSAYLVATGVLAGSGVSSQGIPPAGGEPNLYLLRHGSQPVFIATLSEADGGRAQPMSSTYYGAVSGGEFGDWQAGLGNRTDAVTADGLSAVFMSTRSLPVVGFPHGYPNNGSEEIYSYHAETNELFCISCSATGEPGGAGSYLPVSWSPVHLPEWVADEGNRVFFDSNTSLVSQDTNNRQDVYEWERAGTGSCPAGAHLNGGCIYLLSGGTSEADSWFVAASETGDDVFIVTRAQLTKQDRNDAFDLYDARVGGVEPPSEPACTGTGCQGVPAPPPTFATPPSNTYAGVGNFPPPTPSKPMVKLRKKSAKCKRGFVKKRDRCVKAKAKKKTRKSNRRAK